MSGLNQALLSNFGGSKTNRAKLAQVTPARMWDIVLGWQTKGNPNNKLLGKTTAALTESGWKNPLENRKEIAAYVQSLFERYKPRTELEKAILLLRAILPPSRKFYFAKSCYQGLTLDEGGLAIPPNVDPNKSYNLFSQTTDVLTGERDKRIANDPFRQMRDWSLQPKHLWPLRLKKEMLTALNILIS